MSGANQLDNALQVRVRRRPACHRERNRLGCMMQAGRLRSQGNTPLGVFF